MNSGYIARLEIQHRAARFLKLYVGGFTPKEDALMKTNYFWMIALSLSTAVACQENKGIDQGTPIVGTASDLSNEVPTEVLGFNLVDVQELSKKFDEIVPANAGRIVARKGKTISLLGIDGGELRAFTHDIGFMDRSLNVAGENQIRVVDGDYNLLMIDLNNLSILKKFELLKLNSHREDFSYNGKPQIEFVNLENGEFLVIGRYRVNTHHHYRPDRIASTDYRRFEFTFNAKGDLQRSKLAFPHSVLDRTYPIGGNNYFNYNRHPKSFNVHSSLKRDVAIAYAHDEWSGRNSKLTDSYGEALEGLESDVDSEFRRLMEATASRLGVARQNLSYGVSIRLIINKELIVAEEQAFVAQYNHRWGKYFETFTNGTKVYSLVGNRLIRRTDFNIYGFGAQDLYFPHCALVEGKYLFRRNDRSVSVFEITTNSIQKLKEFQLGEPNSEAIISKFSANDFGASFEFDGKKYFVFRAKE